MINDKSFRRERIQAARVAAVLLPAVLAVMLATVGCGPPATVAVGVVTLDGVPIDNAMLDFIPEQRDARTGSAVTDASGCYAATLAATAYRVTVRKQRSVGESKKDAAKGGVPTEDYEEIFPARYSDPSRSPLRVEAVEHKRTVANFEISSK
ncbi:MAG: hypothetical protein ACKOEX_02705 [Planctomycetia bacterium]